MSKKSFIHFKLKFAVLSVVLNLFSYSVLAVGLPSQAKLQFVNQYGVPATMTFTQHDNQYSINTDVDMIFYQLHFASTGHIMGNRLLPESYRDSRSGKLYAQALFDGQMIQYGKIGDDVKQMKINGVVFDIFTLAWQLALDKDQVSSSSFFTNGKKIYPIENIHYSGKSEYLLNGTSVLTNQFLIQRAKNTIEYALIPSLENIPAQITYTDNGKLYVLKLKTAQLDGKVIKAQ